MGEEKFSLKNGMLYMVPDDGEPTEFVEVQSIESFVDSEAEELTDVDISDCVRMTENAELTMEFSMSRAARKRFLQGLWGWKAKGHVRKKPLLEAINDLARSDLVEYDDAYWKYFTTTCKCIYELVNLNKRR